MAIANTYYQDSEGQWWFQLRPATRRSRAALRQCEHCGQSFPTWRKEGRFCSDRCRHQARQKTTSLRGCAWCGGLFKVGETEQRFCSHRCAARAMHDRRPVTTPGAGTLKNAENPQYSQDAKGQWWYQPWGTKVHPRTRAGIKTCEECGAQFLISVFHRKRQQYCSKSCGLRAFHRANPGKYAGENSGRWKGGRRTNRKGYVERYAPGHPEKQQTGYVFEHRLVMEQILGRPLAANEHVHHKNGQRDDNRPENLELWVGGHPYGQRASDVKGTE